MITDMKQRIVFWGTPAFAVPILDVLIELSIVAALVTQPDRLQGRGRKLQAPSPVKIRALEAQVPVLSPDTLTDPSFIEALRALGPIVFFVAAYGNIIPPSILALSSPAAVNVHPSLLPRYRGPSPIQAALLAQDTVTGVTLIQLDDQMDHGPIIIQKEVVITSDDTALTLSEKLAHEGAQLTKKVLHPYLSGEMLLTPQNHAHATYCKLLRSEDALLDLSKPVAELYAHIRALEPWPGSYLMWGKTRLKIHTARILPHKLQDALFARSEAGNLLIKASDGIIEALTVQLEGKSALSSAAFLRGHPAILETKLS
jgi:methionyl-tRNA formyltransferase